MITIVQSAGGIVYHMSEDGPRYLLIKRHAKSGRIEWVAPKGKLQPGETNEIAALREISEETGLPINELHLKQKIGVTQLRSVDGQGTMNKDVTYFSVEYTGDPDSVKILDGEGYLGVYLWASISQVLELLYYTDMRELIRDAHHSITKQSGSAKVKNDFMKKL